MACAIPYRGLLLWLTVIFALRVIAQFVLQFRDSIFLPAFEHWHSETMPYSTLLIIQCALLILMALGIFTVPGAKIRPRLGQLLMLLAWLYILAMVCRLLTGALYLSDHTWFDGVISTAFHFGLAGYLLVYASAIKGDWQSPNANPVLAIAIQVGTYPFILAGSYLLFNRLLDTGSPLMFSAYLSVLIGASGILIHENLAPSREDWRPDKQEIINDGLFLALVQIALPAVLKALALTLIIWLSKNNVLQAHIFWPHDSPVLLQILLMLVVAEFFRYWIHRAAHKTRRLWKLHAVHHAADKLYTVNVGRFHPFDKALQFLGDTLPFLLLGISPGVFAAYFVLYALNGFYQHSNASVRLGPLNWIIAGPELHRWHHSATVSEAHANYGNNLIIWDVVFGTRFLPANKEVGQVGIGNKKWPGGFIEQLSAPFTTSTERTPISKEN